MAIPEQFRDEVAMAVQDLITKAQELSFEYCTLECSNITTCPLAKKGRELFKVVKTFNEIMKKMVQARQAF